MNTMIKNNFIERVPNDELIIEPGRSWYLSHHGVYHRQKNKLRIVFNCSLKYSGISLNDNLQQGPDLANNMVGVLLRFRQNPIAVVADIEKMFYQVRVGKHHSDLLRFFWIDENNKTVEYRLLVHVFGATSSPSIANFALKHTISDYQTNSDVANTITNNFYVDDLLMSAPTEECAIDLLTGVKQVLATGSFNLTSINSSSKSVVESFPVEDRFVRSVVHDIPDSSQTSDRALGVIWNTQKDSFGYNVKISNNNCVLTKRQILQKLASVYDPLGLASPALIPGKKLFQQSCRLQLGWDDLLPVNVCDAWQSWVKSISLLSDYEIPRCLKLNKTVTMTELNIFADGSETAYGCVAYVRFLYNDCSCSSTVLASKSRLTPLNNSTLKTVPRIELCSAKLGVELSVKIIKELDYNFDNVKFWTDSLTILKYIKNDDGKYHRFVANKVSFIRNFSNPENWYYVPTKLNPADIISRGSTPKKLQSSVLWRCGPEFLINSDIAPPDQNIDYKLPSYDSELKVKTLSATVSCNNEISPTDKIINSVSDWYKLKLRIAALIRIKNSMHSKSKLQTTDRMNFE